MHKQLTLHSKRCVSSCIRDLISGVDIATHVQDTRAILTSDDLLLAKPGRLGILRNKVSVDSNLAQDIDVSKGLHNAKTVEECLSGLSKLFREKCCLLNQSLGS